MTKPLSFDASTAADDDYVWHPTPRHIADANITRFMRRHGIGNYNQLVERSTNDIEWFWDAVVSDLSIDFHAPYHTVLDNSHGIEWPRWFSGGRLNLTYNCVDRHAVMRGEQIAIIHEDETGNVQRISYSELAMLVNRIANGLRAIGVVEGDRVAIYLPMIPEAVAAAYAVAKIGAIFVPIFSGYGSTAVVARLNDSSAKVLITADQFHRRGRPVAMLSVAEEAVALSPSVKTTIVLQRDGAAPSGGFPYVSWQDAFGAAAPDCEAVPLDAETPFMIAYTSGTTGRPKGSVHVHGGFLVKVSAEVSYQLDLKPNDLLYWVTDMGWIMGAWQMIGAHCAGAAIFMYEGALDHPNPSRLWTMCSGHKVTILGVSPTLIRLLASYGEVAVPRHDLSSIRMLGSTGEPIDETSYKWFSRVAGGDRCPIVNMSGGTEVGACFFGLPPVMPTKCCALGPPGLGMALDVYDPDGKSVRGVTGELVCTKPWPSMTRGFWNDRERYLSTYWSRWPGVWVHGDWARVDEDGYWYVSGRSDDTMNIAGKRIGPSEIEAAAIKHKAVAECAAIGVADEIKGTAIWCFCVLDGRGEGNAALADDIKTAVAAELGKAFRPSVIKFVSELPKTRSGKILRRVIRACVNGEPMGDLSSLENPLAIKEIEAAV